MSARISRNVFAREEIHREAVYDAVGLLNGCRWCGQLKHTRGGRPFLYQYRVEHDAGRVFAISGLYCSADCMRAFTEP